MRLHCACIPGAERASSASGVASNARIITMACPRRIAAMLAQSPLEPLRISAPAALSLTEASPPGGRGII